MLSHWSLFVMALNLTHLIHFYPHLKFLEFLGLQDITQCEERVFRASSNTIVMCPRCLIQLNGSKNLSLHQCISVTRLEERGAKYVTTVTFSADA